MNSINKYGELTDKPDGAILHLSNVHIAAEPAHAWKVHKLLLPVIAIAVAVAARRRVCRGRSVSRVESVVALVRCCLRQNDLQSTDTGGRCFIVKAPRVALP